MCFVWISEQTAIISLYSINWLGFYNQDGVCLLRGTVCSPLKPSGYFMYRQV
jgi:nitrate reductase alpha subunit